MTETTSVLVLPGYGDSGPEHWQTEWERTFGYRRVVQADWEHPERADWVDTLARAIDGAPGRIVLVAHSLGCALVAHWAGGGPVGRIAGALLVAPPDVDELQHWMPEVASFAPLPRERLPFPAIVVASTSDPYAEIDWAQATADAWGARFHAIGDAGHVNVEAGFGPWPAGHALLASWLSAT